MKTKYVGLLLLFVGQISFAQSITTLFARNNGGAFGGAVYFDVTVGPNDITITALDLNTSETEDPLDVEVYTLAGSAFGNETNSGAWTLASTGTGTAEGADIPSPVSLQNPIQLDAGTSYGFAIIMDNNHGHDYTNGDGSNQSYSNSDLSLSLGSASNQPFLGSLNDPRVWNGTIYYTLSDKIPTLSQWGIIALSMIMLIFGLVFMKQRKVIFG